MAPVSPVAVRFTSSPDGVSVADAVAVPVLPFAGTSLPALRLVENPKPPASWTWPRISPPGLAAVWTFT